MTTTYEVAVMLVEQLAPVDQARLVALFAEQLQHSLQTEPLPIAADEPAFWHIPIVGTEQPETQSPRARIQHIPLPTRAETQAMATGWFGAPLPEEDALDLAMSPSIAEWNLDK